MSLHIPMVRNKSSTLPKISSMLPIASIFLSLLPSSNILKIGRDFSKVAILFFMTSSLSSSLLTVAEAARLKSLLSISSDSRLNKRTSHYTNHCIRPRKYKIRLISITTHSIISCSKTSTYI